ncbi:GntR family transcriptional regulator [Robertkochia marina]|uniref:GntR family transcriptional regulator n=1 Tax=Robertkochia marina TaxID=1227945 RepID=A0A4S3M1P5_9FLAO|nr:S1-like domain-containing RNA-binding protein [Robertkochia marina]THD68118.1 GntR family transcriptional regulator [Robertkochia marina]TRZ40940.1 GntR family transcriptional regulator [Robertkochia marina]
MIKIGVFNTLNILRHTSVGLFLGDDDGNEILLPNKYVPENYHIGDTINVFCYLDHEERPVAVTLTPKITLNSFALLKVADVTDLGAFMDWGMEKHLFVPFKEQARKMELGKWYLVYMYEDEKTGRLVGSSKTDRFLSNENVDLNRFDAVDLIVYRYTDLGVEVIVNGKYKGLVYKDEIYKKLHLGERLTGVVKKVRDDNKIDISLEQLGFKNLEPSAEKILSVLEENSGFLGLHDKSDPERIKEVLGMSKKSFKKAIGVLYKKKNIRIEDDGIYRI